MLNMSRSPLFKLDFMFGELSSGSLPPYFMEDAAAAAAFAMNDERELTPGDDIWRKFELPTPPRSPGRPDSPADDVLSKNVRRLCGVSASSSKSSSSKSSSSSASEKESAAQTFSLSELDWTSALDDDSNAIRDFLEDVDFDEEDADLSDVLNAFLFDEEQTEEDSVEDDSVDDSACPSSTSAAESTDRVDADIAIECVDHDGWCERSPTTTTFRSELLHDCMWSGQCNEEHRRALMESPSPCPPTSVAAAAASSSSSSSSSSSCNTVAIATPTPSLIGGRISRADSRCSIDSVRTCSSRSSSSSSTSSSSSSSSSASSYSCTAVSAATQPASSSSCIPLLLEHPLTPLPLLLTPCGTPPYDEDSGGLITSIDSKTLLAYPLSDHSYYHALGKQQTTTTTTTPASPTPPVHDHNLGIQTPSDSEEEIDVVTVGDKSLQQTTRATKRQQQQQQQHQQQKQEVVAVQADKQAAAAAAAVLDNGMCQKSGGRGRRRRRSLPSNPSPHVQRQLQLAVAVATQQKGEGGGGCSSSTNDYKRDSKRSLANETREHDNVPPYKKARQQQQQLKRHHHHHHHRTTIAKSDHVPIASPSQSPKKTVNSSSSSSSSMSSGRWSRQSSDSEDVEKRKEHNDLERKRRNDLKSSFQILRKQVPDLQNNDRAPKVLILRKAAEHIRQLTSTFGQLDRVHHVESVKMAELHRKLTQLQRRR